MRRHELTRLERPAKISVMNQQWHEAISTDLELRVNLAGQVSSRCHGCFKLSQRVEGAKPSVCSPEVPYQKLYLAERNPRGSQLS